MSERDDLLGSISNTIKTYRQGELQEPSAKHVDRWVSQFTEASQVAFLREFDHVIKKTFLTKAKCTAFLTQLLSSQKLTGSAPLDYWKKANLLRIQQAGQSQKEMVRLFGEALEQQLGLDLGKCGDEKGDYVYLDDVLFTGRRVLSDLQEWVKSKAPAKANVQVILMALHTGGRYYANKSLKSAIVDSGKDIQVRFWHLVELENRKNERNNSKFCGPLSCQRILQWMLTWP